MLVFYKSKTGGQIVPKTIPTEPIEAFVLAAHTNLEKVKSLLEQEPALLNLSFEKFNETALEAAGHMGREDIANFLLEQGANPQIFAMAMLGHVHEVKNMLENDPSLIKKPGVHGFSLMFHAALSGNLELANILERHGAEIADHSLHAALMKDQLEMLEWLIPRVKDINAPNFQGDTPLAAAIKHDQIKASELLRNAGGHG
jgi:ankyrin repeat protein